MENADNGRITIENRRNNIAFVSGWREKYNNKLVISTIFIQKSSRLNCQLLYINLHFFLLDHHYTRSFLVLKYVTYALKVNNIRSHGRQKQNGQKVNDWIIAKELTRLFSSHIYLFVPIKRTSRFENIQMFNVHIW